LKSSFTSSLVVQAVRHFLFWVMVVLAAATVADDSVETTSVTVRELSERRRLHEGEGGTSCSSFLGSVLPWERPGGDWRDARGKRFGDHAYSEAALGPAGMTLDVTALVRTWAEAGVRRGTFSVRVVAGSGFASFHSREAESPADSPMLVLELAGGSRQVLKPSADTHLDCSTYRALGRSNTLRVMGKVAAVLEFLLPPTVSARSLVRAQLVLSRAGPPGGGVMRIGVFETAVPSFPESPLQHGFAREFPGDKGIERHSDVVFASGFDESGDWRSRWAKESAGDPSVVRVDWPNRFEPLGDKALSIKVKKGSHSGVDLRLYLKDLGGEADELFFRYYIRLGDDWDPRVTAGKLPGLAGTYGKAGWGGRRSDGSNGWSLRGAFLRAFARDHPMHGLTQMATYAYHADMKSNYGDHWIWPGAVLQRNRWYCIEQQVRLNRPNAADGLFRVWVDGRLAMERQNVRLRTVEQLRIETVWLNVYHGGTDPSPYDQHLYFDNIVVARRYIGPMVPMSSR
jgi:hypothetical protein